MPVEERPQERRRLEGQPCECGCGQKARAGSRYLSGHNNRGRTVSNDVRARISEKMTGAQNPRHGERPPNFKGRVYSSGGYVMVPAPGHPFANRKGKVMEHRAVMEAHLREAEPHSPFLVEVAGTRYLRPDCDVHHVDQVRDNNALSNLEVLTKSDHAAHHLEGRVNQGVPGMSAALRG